MITDYIINKMIEAEVILKEDQDIYRYGLREGFQILQNILISVILGMLFGNLVQTIVFLVAYIPLRSYGGGFHASSAIRCFLYSVGLLFLLEYCFTYRYFFESRTLFLVMLLAAGVIYKYSPLDSKNKPLSAAEEWHYALFTKRILMIEIGILAILHSLNLSAAADGIIAALIVEGILMVTGKLLYRTY